MTELLFVVTERIVLSTGTSPAEKRFSRQVRVSRSIVPSTGASPVERKKFDTKFDLYGGEKQLIVRHASPGLLWH
jgi:hypothetical protein